MKNEDISISRYRYTFYRISQEATFMLDWLVGYSL